MFFGNERTRVPCAANWMLLHVLHAQPGASPPPTPGMPALAGGCPGLPIKGSSTQELAQVEMNSLAVIPGWPTGPGLESKNTQAVAIAGYYPCGAGVHRFRARGLSPAPRNDQISSYIECDGDLCTGEPISPSRGRAFSQLIVSYHTAP